MESENTARTGTSAPEDEPAEEVEAALGPSGLRGVSRALRTLMLFRDTPELGVRQISRRLELNPAAAYRIVTTLTEHGFLEQLPGAKTYTLGQSVAELAEVFSKSRGFSQVALSLMSRVHTETKETIGLHVLRDGLRMCLLTLESPQALRMVVPVGSLLPITNGATDLVMHAFAPEEAKKRIAQRLSEPGWQEVESAITGPVYGQLPSDDEVAEVQRRGWAVSYGTRTPGSAAVAVPVNLRHDLYALSVFGPRERIQALGVDTLAAQLKEVATAMVINLDGLQPTLVPGGRS